VGKIDYGLLEMKKNFGRPLTEEEFADAEKLRKTIGSIPEEEMRKRFSSRRER